MSICPRTWIQVSPLPHSPFSTDGNVMRRRNVEKMKAEFTGYIREMPEVLQMFTLDASAAGYKLDYSFGSLGALERYLLSTSPQAPDSLFRNRAARYLGEVFRRELGGRWEISCEDESELFFGLPVIRGYAKVDVEFCPLETIGAFLSDPAEGTIQSIIEGHRGY